MNRKVSIILFLFCWLYSQLAKADVKLNALFSSGMVVQQNTIIPVWGWADANEKITVKASWGEKAETITNNNGTWRANLKTPKAGGPFKIVVQGKNSLVLEDVLAGEVWLCTGQSNMDFEMYRFLKDAREAKYQPLVEEFRNEVATANDPWIRHIEVPQTTSLYKKRKNFKAHWRTATKEQIDTITATGYYFAKELRKYLNVPIGLVECSWGGTRIQPWISENAYLESSELKELYNLDIAGAKQLAAKMNTPGLVDAEYEKALKTWIEDGKKGRKPGKPTHPKDNKQIVSTLYNGMLATVIPYKIKGIIWYQGEGNSRFRSSLYGTYLETLITSWRKEWEQNDLPFYFTQLAAFKGNGTFEQSNGWATVSDQMRRTLKLHNTGMAVLCDIGESEDVHPHNKMDAGKRLSLWALRNEYGIEIRTVSGPLYSNSEIVQNKIVIEFTETGKGLIVGKKELTNDVVEVNQPLSWFEIAGDDGNWKPAKAQIISKTKIEVFSKKVKKPVHVRYAWSCDPQGVNLYNQEGLPAAVFTTEND